MRKLGLKAGAAEPRQLARPAAPAAQSGARDHASPWWASTPSTATPTSRSTRPSTMPASHHRAQVRIQRIHSEAVEREGPERLLAGVDGMLVPGGFGERGIEGKVDAVRFARAARHPLLRHLPGHAVRRGRVRPQRARAWSGPTPPSSTRTRPHPVICLLDEQKTITDKGGTMRLGAQPARLARRAARRPPATAPRRSPSGTATATSSTTSIASSSPPTACRWSAPAPTARWSKSSRLPDHPWFVGVQYHPEFKSQPTRPHPLFAGFVGAAVRHRLAVQVPS